MLMTVMTILSVACISDGLFHSGQLSLVYTFNLCLLSSEFLIAVGVSCYHLDLCSDLCRMSSTLAFSGWK